MDLECSEIKIPAHLQADWKAIQQRLVSAEERVSSGHYNEEHNEVLLPHIHLAFWKLDQVRKSYPDKERQMFLREARELLEWAEERLDRLHEKEQAPSE
jgi:hypothetical protein